MPRFEAAESLAKSPDRAYQNCTDLFPLLCQPTQCPICIGDKRKSYNERIRELSRRSKMMDYVATHLSRQPPYTPIYCHHPRCRADRLVLDTLEAFKNHIARVHGIVLRR